MTDTTLLGKDDVQLQPRCGQLQKIKLSFKLMRAASHMVHNGFADSPFFQATQATKVDTSVVCALVSQNGTMCQSVVTFLSITCFGSFWGDVEMGQSTNQDKHLKIQGLSRFHGLQAFLLVDFSITAPSHECLQGYGRLVGGLSSKDIQKDGTV